MPFPPCPPMKVYASPSHHFRQPPGVSPLGFSGAPPEGSSGRSSTVDWFCLGPAQQRSCIASWGCGPSSRGPDLTIPPCGCRRPATGSVLCPHRIRTGFCLTAGAQRRVKRRRTAGRRSQAMDPRRLQRQQHHQIFSFAMAAWDKLAFFK